MNKLTPDQEVAKADQAVLFCHVKNEAPFLLEWIAYHQAIGFDRIVICSNPSTDGTEEILAALAAMQEITHLRTVVKDGESVHQAAVAEFNRSCGYKIGCWYMWLDADEFLNVHVGDGTVKDLRSELNGKSGIIINWRIFGSSGNIRFPGRFVDPAFSMAASDKRVANLEVKTFFRYTDNYAGFSPKFSHRPLPKKGASINPESFLAGNGRPIMASAARNLEWLSGDDEKSFHIVEREEFGWRLAQVNHYAVRTPEMYQLKRLRGRAAVPVGRQEENERYKESYYTRYNKNDVKDTSILRWKHQTDTRINSMLLDPVLKFAIKDASRKTTADLALLGMVGAVELPRPSSEESSEEPAEKSTSTTASKNMRPVRPIDRIRLLHRIVKATRKTVVVDVGANPFNGTAVYALLRRSGVARIIGFEPQADALGALQAAAGPNETYLPYAVGAGGPETLYVTKNSGLVSTLEPDPWIAEYLNPWWRRAIDVRQKLPITTGRLDDIDEVDHIDFLKIDIQGGELAVFQNARRKLSKSALIQTEVPIIRYYKGQPSLGEIQAELESQGFLAHKFMEMSAHLLDYSSLLAERLPLRKSQATVADIAFVRSPVLLTDMGEDTLQHMAILADSVLQSFDLVFRCLGELVRRKIVRPDEVKEYVALLRQTVKMV